MQLINEFAIPVPVDQAWPVLLDIERMARCVPGASVTSLEGDCFTGTVRVKVGPVSFQYAGRATFVEVRPDDHLLVLEGSGREKGGNGAVRAAVTLHLTPAGDDASQARVTTDLDITGKAAQFGRAVINQVTARLVDDFAARLAQELAQPLESTAAPDGSPPPAGRTEPTTVALISVPQVAPSPMPQTAPSAAGSFDPVKALIVPLFKDNAAMLLAGAALGVSIMALRRARRGPDWVAGPPFRYPY